MVFKILLVDDSTLSREVVKDILSSIEEVTICGEASNGKDGITKIITERPDLVIMDVEMPVMNGLECLSELQARGIDTPVVMLSVLTQKGAGTTIEALERGALDFIPKPSPDSFVSIDDMRRMIQHKITGIIEARKWVTESLTHDVRPVAKTQVESPFQKKSGKVRLLVIGSSTGGPRALNEIFAKLPANLPVPIVVVQHMPPVFTEIFAKRLNDMSKVTVSEIKDGDLLKPGQAYIAPGNYHVTFSSEGKALMAHLDDSEKVNNHRPSIDVTLKSVISELKGELCGLIMTGMGTDGAEGMLKLKEAGGITLAQDKESSVIFGMNRQAIKLGAIDKIVQLSEIPASLQKICETGQLT